MKKIFLPFFLLFFMACLMISCVFLFSCQSARPVAVKIPEISYPEFPVNVNDSSVKMSLSDDGQTVEIHWLDDGRQVCIPMWFWIELVEYSADVDSAIEQYKAVLDILSRPP